MPSPTKLDWTELLGLHVVRKVEKLAARRWNLGFGYIDATRDVALAPRLGSHGKSRGPCQILQDTSEGRASCVDHAGQVLADLLAAESRGELKAVSLTKRCHAGLTEIVAPVVVDQVLIGALLCGGYLLEEDDRDEFETIAEHVPRLGRREASFVQELLEEAASEIAAFLIAGGRLTTEADGAKRNHYDGTIGSSQPMQALYSLLDKVVASDSTVLVTGENGTGKELVARAIHYRSSRKKERFVVHNCSAFNDNLIDSELFGHKRGAFTGAVSDKKGLFEIADKGTFFLDEIGDMSPTLQVKVLRVLQEGTFTPVGGTDTVHVDVRIVAATNRDLKAMVELGTFREDLYYRINVINLKLPSLRDRSEDLELLIEHFLAKHEGGDKRLTPECLDRMRGYHWPGNVRELENEIERLVVLAGDSPVLSEELLSARMRSAVRTPIFSSATPTGSLPDAVRNLERRMIHDALVEHSWNKTRAAAQLQVSRRNLIRLVQKYDLDREREPEALS